MRALHLTIHYLIEIEGPKVVTEIAQEMVASPEWWEFDLATTILAVTDSTLSELEAGAREYALEPD
jgi:hypothetical protein